MNNRNLRLVALLVFLTITVAFAADAAPRRVENFNRDWKFARGSQAGAEAISFNDSAWLPVRLPHDWAISGPYEPQGDANTGKLPWRGEGWYRKSFTLPAADAGQRVYLDFDGVMAMPTVYVNGQKAGGWDYGYMSFRVDATDFVKAGQRNVVAVHVDTRQHNSRWYPGAGIYRKVQLVVNGPVHVAQWGTFVTTPQVASDSATIRVETTLENHSVSAVEPEVETTLLDPKGKEVAKWRMSFLVPANGSQPGVAMVTLRKPQLWDIETPRLYTAVMRVWVAGKLVDSTGTPFGIRTFEFTANDGFHLNGRRVQLHGVCLHSDLGPLGMAFNTRAMERELQIVQDMGVNAIRTSHNPPAPELLELCDRLGMLVMDEAFDCWRHGKRPNDYQLLFDDWSEKDLRALVRRDRNHPCVILWSIGNEVREQWEPDGWRFAAHLAGIVREEDRTRFIISGCNNVDSGYNGFQAALDVMGYNYKPGEYGKFHAGHPTQPVLGSETSSCVSSRGEYFFPVSENKADGRADFQVSSYDLYAPRWALKPDVEFKGLDEFPFTAGEFVWTGFDYLGEPTPYNADSTNLLNFSDPAERDKMAKELKELGRITVPSRSSYFGIIDLAGFKKDRFFIYQARWRPDLPMAHLLPHWNWPDRVGQVTPVFVYTSGDEAELFLNGKSLGRRQRGPLEYRLRWDDVKYEPGELHVVAYQHGRKWAEDVVKTTGAPARVLLAADRAALTADGSDLSFVTVTIADQGGLLVPRSRNRVKFEIAGPGEIVAVDNGDATSFEPFQASERSACNGLALVIVRTKAGEPGVITLKAQAAGLTAAEITLTSAGP